LDDNNKFSKILVPIDGSEPSFHAAQVAISIAEKFKGKIILLHVIVSPLPHDYANLTGLVTPKQIDKIILDARKETNLWFERIKDSSKFSKQIDITTEVILTGLAAYGEIIQYTEREEVNLIVLGTRGITKFKKLLLGSTASGVITYAHCPVMVVK
jgi:nucleotide-binding universal stress UspA family protein